MKYKLVVILGLVFGLLLSMSASAEQSNEGTYTLQKGDTLWHLCKRFKQKPETCWPELSKTNKFLQPNRLSVGTVVVIPEEWNGSGSASLDAISGKVILKQKGQTKVLTESNFNSAIALQVGDVITTDPNSFALLLLEDETKIRIFADSKVTIKKLGSHGQIFLEQGQVRSLVNPNKRKSQFEVLTPYAVAAVRGTDFAVRVSDKKMFGEVLSGQVDVGTEEKVVSLEKGYASVVLEGGLPSDPIKMLETPYIYPSPEGSKRSNIEWEAVRGADHYSLELRKEAGDRFKTFANSVVWRTVYEIETMRLEPGVYQAVLQAIDSNGIYGMESVDTFVIKAPDHSNGECEFLKDCI